MPTLPPALSQAISTFTGMQPAACHASAPPHVEVISTSRDIAYDFSRGEHALTKVQTDYASPYPPSADAVTRGLRADRPEFKLEASWHDTDWPLLGKDCLSYDTVTLSIRLQPRIFVAKEVQPGVCQDTILAHERHHVDIDREVLAEYTPQLREAIERDVGARGEIGPLPHGDVKATTNRELDEVGVTVTTVEKRMAADLDQRQQAFDSLKEYTRVSEICHRAELAGR